MMINKKLFLILFAITWMMQPIVYGQVAEKHNLVFDELADRWDEAMPLGNGILGALIWEKDGKLRLGLDRADLWDLRRTPEFDSPNFSTIIALKLGIQRPQTLIWPW